MGFFSWQNVKIFILMKRILTLVLTLSLLLASFQSAFAIESPVLKQNNRIGIHILFPSEINNAAKLINSNGGDWGYVVIPIQSGDKDIERWQGFFDEAISNHVIPILRLSTEGEYFNTSRWRKPTDSDLVDFANFLNSLEWPVKNRYIIVYNEVNRGDEWGGTPNPGEYAQILNSAVDIFKSRNKDFFIISAGLDNAAPSLGNYLNQYDFLREVESFSPGIFNKIDGMSSHSYPNPGFAQEPDRESLMGTGSYLHESLLINEYRDSKIPIFITETGWKIGAVTEDQASEFLGRAYREIWTDPNIVTVSPFLLNAGDHNFQGFSLIDSHGNKRKTYNVIEKLSKAKGQPSINNKRVLSVTIQKAIPIKEFSKFIKKSFPIRMAESIFEFFLRL